MRVNYKGCGITCEHCEEQFITFSIFDEEGKNKGYEVTSGFSESADTVRDWMKTLKSIVDDYRENPEDYE